jgi:hypothetical protein
MHFWSLEERIRHSWIMEELRRRVGSLWHKEVLIRVEAADTETSDDGNDADAYTSFAACAETAATANTDSAVLSWQVRNGTDCENRVLGSVLGFDSDVDLSS